MGCAGNYAAPPANQIVHAAELVVFVGCQTGDQVTHTWRIPAIDTPCVQIDLDPRDLGRSYPNTIGVMGDPKATSGRVDPRTGPTRAGHRVRRLGRGRHVGLAAKPGGRARQQRNADLAGPAV